MTEHLYNILRVVVRRTADGNESVQIDETVGTFSPGTTAEGVGTSEIEIAVDLLGGSDTVYVIGTFGNDDTDLTSTGVDLYDDGDTDIALSNVETLDVRGSDGDDILGGASTPASR